MINLYTKDVSADLEARVSNMYEIAKEHPYRFGYYFVLTFLWLVSGYITTLYPSFQISEMFILSLFSTSVGFHLAYVAFKNAWRDKYYLGMVLAVPIGLFGVIGLILFAGWFGVLIGEVSITEFYS